MNQATKDMLTAVKESQYGPYGFGVATAMLFWFAIVAPTLEANRIDFEEQRAVVLQMRTIADAMQATAHTLERIQSRQGTLGTQMGNQDVSS